MRYSMLTNARVPRWCGLLGLGLGMFLPSCSDDGGTPAATSAGCTKVDAGDGTFYLECDGTRFDLDGGKDGKDGADGTDGTNGVDGEDGAPGKDGTDGGPGQDGTDGQDGENGEDGADGKDGLSVLITDRHGSAFLQSTGEFAAGKYMADAAITSATADAAGVVSVAFTVKDKAGKPIVGLPKPSFTIAKLLPGTAEVASSQWVPYLYATETVAGTTFPMPDKSQAERGGSENTGVFVDNNDGSYTYTFAANLSAVKKPVSLETVTFDRSATHRVSVMMGGRAGATATATFDFVPDGSPVTETRNIVETATCKQCHGEEFHGHGGNRLTVENCVTCHNPSGTDAQSGESLDMKVMIHKIHAGAELASLAGPDGKVWDDLTTTAVDESADNGSYAIWGYKTTKYEWADVEFPAVIENCRKCHQGAGAEVDNYKTVPSRAACGSCHDDVDFTVGTNHQAGSQVTDANCALCHTANAAIGAVKAHDWTQKDVRNLPEFDATVTVTGAANGEYFVAGESPIVTITLKDKVTGLPIDHTTVVKDTDKESCTETLCADRDGKFAAAYLMVAGPRAKRNPVLSTLARAKLASTLTGPFDLSATGASLVLTVDGGLDVMAPDAFGRVMRYAGLITVPVDKTKFVDLKVATAAEIIAWLNGAAAFKARAIAYLEGDKVAIRSRNLGDTYSVQLAAGAVTTAVFNGDVAVKVQGGTYNLLFNQAPAANDPKVQWTPEAITYTLDPVDDLVAGTYVASIEISDRGRTDSVNYRTPTVAKVPFQVKTETEELPPAGNCDSCHEGPEGTGFVLDFSRHNKHFDEAAIDQCAGCHDYQTSTPTASTWGGAKPIARRVHAIHMGVGLNYPYETVGYSGGDGARNWQIAFPQDVRNCETCHADDSTSGTWATEASRVPCAGCHDALEATAHIKQQTWDPTPTMPFSGDEEESCKVCH